MSVDKVGYAIVGIIAVLFILWLFCLFVYIMTNDESGPCYKIADSGANLMMMFTGRGI